MESVLVSRISVVEWKVDPCLDCSQFVLKTFSGSCIYWTAYPFADVFLMVFPWNSVDVLLYKGVEVYGQVRFDPGDKEIQQGVIEINKDGLVGSVSLQLNFSYLPDFKQVRGTDEKLFLQYKDDLKDVKILVQELLKESKQEEIMNKEDEEGDCIMGFDLEVLSKDEMNTEGSLNDLLLGVNEKLKVLTGIQIILQETEKMNQKSLKAREDLQGVIQDKIKSDEIRQKDIDRVLKEYQDEVNKVKTHLSETKDQNRAKDLEILGLTSKLHELESEKSTLLVQVKNFDSQEEFIRNLQNQISTLEKERDQLRADFIQSQEDNSNLSTQKDQEFEKISEKNKELEDFITAQQHQILTLESQISQQQLSILTQSSEIQALTSELKCLQDQESKALSMEALCKKHQAECIKTQENMQKTTSKFSEILKNLNLEKMKLLKSISDLQAEILTLNNKFKLLEEKFLAENAKNLELKSKNVSLLETIHQSVDSQHISKSLLRLYSDYSRSKSQFVLDASLFITLFRDQAQELLTTNRYLEQLRVLLSSKDEEILIFRDIITELQRRIPYFPVKDDEVDQAMADYINALPDPLQIPFIREDSGIYLFGTKKVFIKLDNNKLSSNN